jgi:hypothetical protein
VVDACVQGQRQWDRGDERRDLRLAPASVAGEHKQPVAEQLGGQLLSHRQGGAVKACQLISVKARPGRVELAHGRHCSGIVHLDPARVAVGRQADGFKHNATVGAFALVAALHGLDDGFQRSGQGAGDDG